MKKMLFAIKDNKVGFLAPMVDDNENTAIRNFKYAVSNNDILNFAPSDFDLFRIGEFDTDSGIITALSSPDFICNGINVKEKEDEI